MVMDQLDFLRDRIAHLQTDLFVAAYTKVPLTWRDDDYTPDFNKFYFILEGEGFVTVAGQQYYPKPGQLYVLPAGVLQSYGTISSNTFGKYWCHFSAKLGDIDLFSITKTPAFIQVSDPSSLQAKFEQLIHWHHRSDITAKARISSILLDIVSTFLEECEWVHVNTNSVASLEKIQTAIEYIQTHLSNKLSVEELAQYLHFHPNYFIRVFKKTTGLSPVQYINRLRIDRAKHSLTFSNDSILSIADSLGMELGYFSRMFKVHTGFAPTQYREMVSKHHMN